MRRALLDVNVLLALLDGDHLDHETVSAWLDREADAGWSSCAVTQNGFVRIRSQSRYPNSVAPRVAVDLLDDACSTERHVFHPCDVSILDRGAVDRSRLHGASQVTDAYLLALAVAHDERLVTLDRTIPLSAAAGATEDHLVVL